MKNRLGALAVLAAATFLMVGVSLAQQPQQGNKGASAQDKCGEFNTALKLLQPPADKSDPEAAERAPSKLADIGLLGQACAGSLTDRLKQLRDSGKQAEWSVIEKALDEMISAHRGLLEKVEGTDGLMEQIERSIPRLEARIEEARTKYKNDEALQKKEISRLERLKLVQANVLKQKSALDQALLDIVAQKPRIAFEQSGKMWDSAIMEISRFSDAIGTIVKSLPRQDQRPKGPGG